MSSIKWARVLARTWCKFGYGIAENSQLQQSRYPCQSNTAINALIERELTICRVINNNRIVSTLNIYYTRALCHVQDQAQDWSFISKRQYHIDHIFIHFSPPQTGKKPTAHSQMFAWICHSSALLTLTTIVRPYIQPKMINVKMHLLNFLESEIHRKRETEKSNISHSNAMNANTQYNEHL